MNCVTGADPVFLEREFICIKVWGFALLILSHYPHAFLKKRRGYCNRLRLSVMLSPPKPLDEIQPNLVCELLT